MPARKINKRIHGNRGFDVAFLPGDGLLTA